MFKINMLHPAGRPSQPPQFAGPVCGPPEQFVPRCPGCGPLPPAWLMHSAGREAMELLFASGLQSRCPSLPQSSLPQPFLSARVSEPCSCSPELLSQ